MGGGPARIYPKANTTAQWWETAFDRGTFSRIEKILLHTTETTSWPGYKSGASAPTLTYHPRQRAWRQHNYLDRSARALVDPTGTAVRENRDNVIQIEIIAYSDEKIAATIGGLKVSQLTDDHYRDLAEFYAFIRREWGGPPLRAPKFLAYPQSYGNSSVRMSGPEFDSYQGLVGHQHASGNDHGDPSNIDAPKILRMVQAIEGGTSPTPVPEEDDMAMTPAERQAFIEDIADEVWGRKVADNPATLDLHVLNANAKAGRNEHALKRVEAALASSPQKVAELLREDIAAAVREAAPDASADAIVDALARRLADTDTTPEA